jgi:hypothetical protein
MNFEDPIVTYCAVKIKPANTSTMPIISTSIFMYYKIKLKSAYVYVYVINIHYFIYTFSNFIFIPKKDNSTFLNCQLILS